ncbi:MAG: hypothetical protein IKR04_04030 [Clostridia bacterium]|nr:hypothetical protein [Clostridia bacterium]
MKRIISLFLATLLCVMMFSTFTAAAEGEPFERNDGMICVLRPNIKCVYDDGDSTTLHFGEEVEVWNFEDTYAIIKTADGKMGKVTVGFIGTTCYPILWIDREGCFLSPMTGLQPTDFYYGACGQRWEERAIVLIEDGDYFFIVTDEGFSGYVRKDNPHLHLYTGQVPEGS